VSRVECESRVDAESEYKKFGYVYTVTGNTIHNCFTDYEHRYGGIRMSTGGELEGNVMYATVEDNVIWNGTNGILELETCNFNIIQGNIIQNISGLKLEVVGPDSIAQGNIMDPPNRGIAHIPSGQSSQNVTVGYISSSNDTIQLTIQTNPSLKAGEGVKIDAIFVGENKFRVSTIDGGPASQNIYFSYYIINRGGG
jgi:hypothetical protein